MNAGRAWSGWHRYAAAILFSLVALGLRLALDRYVAGVQFITFFPAVIAAAYLFGLRPGLLATGVSTLLSWYFLIPNRNSFSIDDPAYLWSLLLFAFIAAAASFVLARGRSWQRELLEAERALNRSEERYRQIFEQVNDIVFTADLDQNITDCNQAAADAVGAPREALIGRNISAFVTPDTFARTTDKLRHKLEHGGTTQYEVELKSLTGKQLFWEINSGLASDAEGRVVGLFAVGRDITERRASDERQRLLVNELNHRVKNTLAIVQALAQQSFRGGQDPAAMRAAFEGRLSALSAAHNLLTEENWESASVGQIVRDGVCFHDLEASRIRIDGPELRLHPQTAVGLALVVHELTTNAIKYGSLSVPEGTVEVTWGAEDGHLKLLWQERGGPPVKKPLRRGFGTRLIERSLPSEVGGRAALAFHPEGLRCEIEAPLPA